MKKLVYIWVLLAAFHGFSQQDTTLVYKKRVLEATEVDFLSSYYAQDGNNAAVTGGIGNERLTDITPTIVVTMPLNPDDILTVDVGISTYTSASSSNLNPFDGSNNNGTLTGSPWVESSGASRQDTWGSATVSYTHNSDDRNSIWNANVSFATEYDYTSIGFGGGYSRLFNEKNRRNGC